MRPLLAALCALVLLSACSGARAVRERLAPSSPRERYSRQLDDAGLAATALGRDWAAAGDAALLATRAAVTTPWRESGYLARDEARAPSALVRVRAGQQLRVRAWATAGEPAVLFVDVFRIEAGRPPELVRGAELAARVTGAAAGRGGAAPDSLPLVTVDADDDGTYLVRLQPELLRAVRYDVLVEAGASLAFPVGGRDARATQSFFGAARDGGARRHEGVDIFAPRGTPAVAAVDGVIRNVGETELGGLVVWLSDPEHGQSLYYAHLDSQTVVSGQRVRIGDTLGLVGNTGNARTTSPHLHFGIYRRGRGAVDPFPFVDEPRVRRTLPPDLPLGGWRRVSRRGGAALADAPTDSAARVGAVIPTNAPLRVDGALSGGWLRVRTADGRSGYLQAAATEPADAAPLARRASVGTVRERPTADAPVVTQGGAATVLGRVDGYDLVRTEAGRVGWAVR